MSKKKRDSLDAYVSRILLILLGLASLAIAITMQITTSDGGQLVFIKIIVIVGSIVGVVWLGVALLSSDRTVVKWAEKSGNHEVLIIFVLLAHGIASITRS